MFRRIRTSSLGRIVAVATACTLVWLTGAAHAAENLNDAGQLTSQANPFSETTSYTLDNDGRITQQTNANGTKVIPTYDTYRGWVTGITHKNSSNTVLADYAYTRDSAGIITGESQSGAYSVSYTYDNAYQLTEEARTGTAAYDYTYTYDSVGNRLTKYDGTTTESYTYDDADKLTAAGSKSYAYDNAGNLTSVTVGSNTTNLSWDYASRLTGITYPNSSTNSFTYNDLGQRTSKTDSTGTTASLFDGSRVLADSRADYTTGGLTGLVSERASGTTSYYHGDQLGSTRGLTNSSQSVTASRERDAWGNVISSSGTLAGPFGFVGGQGYQQDPDSGLMLLGARYYDPSVGRFISRDSLRFAGGDVNIYRYSANSPANGTDPSGEELGWGTVIGAVGALAVASIAVAGAPITFPAVVVAVGGGIIGSATIDHTNVGDSFDQGMQVGALATPAYEISALAGGGGGSPSLGEGGDDPDILQVCSGDKPMIGAVNTDIEPIPELGITKMDVNLGPGSPGYETDGWGQFGDGAFGRVTGTYVPSSFIDYDTIATESFRVLRPGGTFDFSHLRGRFQLRPSKTQAST